MVCYARPVSLLTGIVLVVFLAIGRPTIHFFDTAALVVAVTVAMAAAAVAAALVFAASMSTRRRRAAAGACVSCQFRCQHAMTGPPDHGQPRPAGVTGLAGAAPRVLLPIQPVAPMPVRHKKDLELLPAGTGPRWPDRPIYRTEAGRQRAT